MAGKRGRSRKSEVTQAVLVKNEEFDDLEKMTLETFDDYKKYNEKARRLSVPCKVPPLYLHKHFKCKVTRLDGQERNAIRVRKRNHLIDFDDTILPGTEVEIPEAIIDFLHSLVYPQYKEVTHPDGTSETVFSHNMPRFAVQVFERG